MDSDEDAGDDPMTEPPGKEPSTLTAEPSTDELHTECVQPRNLAELPALFTRLEERKAEQLHYLGVSFGLTPPLLKFWQRLGYVPIYLRQTASDVTGEHTCIVLQPLSAPEVADSVRHRSWSSCVVRAAVNLHIQANVAYSLQSSVLVGLICVHASMCSYHGRNQCNCWPVPVHME
jgi:hypothetical protein